MDRADARRSRAITLAAPLPPSGTLGTRPIRRATIAASLLVALTAGLLATARTEAQETYRNPLDISSPVGPVENCADPTVTRARTQSGAWRWYLYCTKDPRNDDDRNASGQLAFQRIPMYRSTNLIDWTYQGNVFSDANYPAWAQPDAGLFAPEIVGMNGRWYLYYSVTDVKDDVSGEPGCNSDNAIGVATGPTPLGPWTDSGQPIIEPRQNGTGCNFFWTIDPEIETVDGQRYLFWGSYYGGILARRMARNGLDTAADSQRQITIPNKFEGPEIVRRDGWFYLMASATNCCNGPLTGYSVFVGRSRDILGPYVDQDGISLLAGRTGGTPVLTMNGNRWVGPGHNTVFKDFSGRHWTIYHAVDRSDPYFAGTIDFTKRPPLLDPIAWVDGWPRVRAGRWASDVAMPRPAAQPGMGDRYEPRTPWRSQPGRRIEGRSDEFNGELGAQWTWIRGDAANANVVDGQLQWDTQAADLYVDSDSASVLVEDAPDGDYVVEARIRMAALPAEGCPVADCYNYRQGGLVIYGGDDRYLKLVHASIWETRQTEWAKEVPEGARRYGNTIVGPPATWTTLRIVKVDDPAGGPDWYQAWTRAGDGAWVRGGTWRQAVRDERIGLVSMGGAGSQLRVDWVRVYRLDPRGPRPVIEP